MGQKFNIIRLKTLSAACKFVVESHLISSSSSSMRADSTNYFDSHHQFLLVIAFDKSSRWHPESAKI